MSGSEVSVDGTIQDPLLSVLAIVVTDLLAVLHEVASLCAD